jgi:hypothetical protein
MATDECRGSGRQRCERAVTPPAPRDPPEAGPFRHPAPWKSGHILVTIPNRVATILAPMAIPEMRSDGHDESPTTELVSGTVGDRCTNCQKPLAADQRYCVNCGTRRGKPRFSFDSLAAQSAAAKEPEPKPHRSRMSSATTLVAGVATLLLALGVGVLIGHNSNSTPQRASAPAQIVTVGGGASTGTTAGANNAAAGNATANLKKHGKVHQTKQVVVHLNAATKAKASAAAAHVFGNNGGNLVNNPTQQVGSACSGGAGCNNGKFDGNFFGNTP